MSNDENVINLRPRGGPQSPPLPPPGPPPLPSAFRTQPPELPAAPPAVSDDQGDEAAVLPSLPTVAEMRPPLPALPVPSGAPLSEPIADEGKDKGAFALPPLADPDNPTAREMLATAMVLVTALGVAAAQGMWHRARNRRALADVARASADKRAAKAAGSHSVTRKAGGSGSSGGSSGSLLRSPGGGSAKGSRAFARRAGGGGGGRPTGSGKASRGPKGGGSLKGLGPSSGKGASGSRASRGGKAASKRPSGSGKSGAGSRLRRPTGSAGTGGKPSKSKRPGGGSGKTGKGSTTARRGAAGGKGASSGQGRKLTWKAKGGPGKGALGSKRPGGPPRLTWKAPKSGSGKSGTAGTKRWATGRKGSTAGPKSSGGSRARRLTRKGRTWLKRWRTGRAGGKPSEQDSPRPDHGTPDQDGETRARQKAPPPPPPPGFGGMRPPPGGADRSVRVTVQRVDERPWPRPEAAALTVGQAALTAGPAAPPTVRPAPPSTSAASPQQQGAPIVSTPVVRTTQYADAELTIHDVIDADADMAEEIVDGVADARATADGCERLMSKLEAISAEIVELKVPGVLAGMLLRLIDKTLTVKARAEAIAANLPAAAEAISVAGSNAETRHKPLADAVRDAGHTRPAERKYHDE